MDRAQGLVVVVMTVLLAMATDACVAGDRDAPRSGPGDDPTSLEAKSAQRAGPPDAEPPRLVVLPSGRRVALRPARTLRHGLLGVPDDVRRAGWWRGSARLGAPFGSTLVAGHVDGTDQGLGAFAELLSVHVGQRVAVRSRTLRQTFQVRSLRLVPQGRLDPGAAFLSVRGPRRLTLLTCAPPYLPDRGGYQQLAVVTAVPAGPVRGGRS